MAKTKAKPEEKAPEFCQSDPNKVQELLKKAKANRELATQRLAQQSKAAPIAKANGQPRQDAVPKASSGLRLDAVSMPQPPPPAKDSGSTNSSPSTPAVKAMDSHPVPPPKQADGATPPPKAAALGLEVQPPPKATMESDEAHRPDTPPKAASHETPPPKSAMATPPTEVIESKQDNTHEAKPGCVGECSPTTTPGSGSSDPEPKRLDFDHAGNEWEDWGYQYDSQRDYWASQGKSWWQRGYEFNDDWIYWDRYNSGMYKNQSSSHSWRGDTLRDDDNDEDPEAIRQRFSERAPTKTSVADTVQESPQQEEARDTPNECRPLEPLEVAASPDPTALAPDTSNAAKPATEDATPPAPADDATEQASKEPAPSGSNATSAAAAAKVTPTPAGLGGLTPESHTDWRRDKYGNPLTPGALYMRFYRSIRSAKTPEELKEKIAAAMECI